ncbi:MAG: hypothetical protein M3O23_07590, partial [Actinomycetota bacterium]|nr:hypothetical protein [Actinomycetota bacterium]
VGDVLRDPPRRVGRPLLWTGRPRPPAAGAAGLLLGAAAVTRGAGLPLAVPALLYLLAVVPPAP